MYYYPAKVIHNSEGFAIKFINFDCIVKGATLIESYEKAQYSLGKYLNGLLPKDIPLPDVDACYKLDSNENIIIIFCDLDAYRKKHDNVAVKKTLTIPSWLNSLAEEQDLKFSQILQDALKKELGIS
jgi:hypothetical protein